MNFIPQVEPYVTEKEGAAVAQYLGSGGWLTEFHETKKFAAMIAEFVGSAHCDIVTSGTTALYLSLLALGVGPGDSVIVPDFTMIATPNAVKWAGADVILCDVERDTLCLDLNKIELQPNTKALIYVSINGRSGNMHDVVQFCIEHNLFLIEDACQALGSKYAGQCLGTFGDIGVYSFTPHKIITTGQGGTLVTNRPELHERIQKLKDFQRIAPGVDVHTGVGFNFKFTDVQAVIGIEQLKLIDFRMQRRLDVYEAVRKGIEGIKYLDLKPLNRGTVPWFVDALLKKDVSRESLIGILKRHGIGSRPFYPPVHTQLPYAGATGDFSVSTEIAAAGLWLPSSISLTSEQIDHVVRTLRDHETHRLKRAA